MWAYYNELIDLRGGIPMNNNFLFEYIKHPRSVGAIAPSSGRLAKRMMDTVDFENCNCIIEYGPGTGVFTEEIIKRRKSGAKVLLIECNEDFYKILKEKYGKMDNVYIVNDSAEKVDLYMKEHNIDKAGCIVSGLPFASLPRELSEKILENTSKVLNDGGSFITFQYTKLKIPMINNYFSSIKVTRELLNMPPAYVLTCGNK